MDSRAARFGQALVAACLLLLLAQAPGQAQLPATYCQLPAQPPAASADQAAFSEYAWQLFAALNWPAQSGQRGAPSCSTAFGAGGPVVWETFKTTQQIFLADAADPGPWDQGAAAPQSLSYIAKAPRELPVEESIQQAVGGWLIDQQGNPTYYQIAVNQVSYDYVLDNQYYNADVVNQAQQLQFPDGAMEIKASWRLMTAADDQSRYHTTRAQVMAFDAKGDPTGQYREQTIGLVGLHVIHKAPGFPQWIWATFEHLDNAPDAAVADSAAGTFAYFDPQCDSADCPPNVSPLTSGASFQTPNQLTRLSPIRAATAASNAAWQQRLAGTPYQYYELISPQWPSDPLNPGNPQGTPTPGTVANITMESYVQPTSSCMDCHSTARVPDGDIKSDFSFIFLFAQTPQQGGN